MVHSMYETLSHSISQLSNSFVKHPSDVVKVGDVVKVKVLSVDEDKKRIALSMKK
ncbi:MAG: S1 RNA-binding domain-containing protein [Clostridiales bacterium]|nr:S1 RNA-binding domain-containing protein [Clostridiales bacterium]